MAKNFHKDELFENFFRTTVDVFALMKALFGVDVFTEFFGVHEEEINTLDGADKAQQSCRRSQAWADLSELYDYAVDGILNEKSVSDPMEHAAELVIGGAEVLSLITTENNGPSEQWDHVVALGDGRYGLDTGEDIELKKLALLAGIDQRTVRNAISANELDVTKVSGTNIIPNKSALKWLASRRGYTPTRFLAGTGKKLSNISSATELGAYLSQRREVLNIELEDDGHPTLSAKSLFELESGQFTSSLDDVYTLADFYHVDSGELLDAVMRSFYSQQFKTIIERNC